MSAESAYTWLPLMSTTPLTVIKHCLCREAFSVYQFCELMIIHSNGMSKVSVSQRSSRAVPLIALRDEEVYYRCDFVAH